MKKVLFVINTLGGAGAEKALLELLKRFTPDRYEGDLYVLLGQGELISQVPGYVNILNRDYTAESVLSAEGKKKLNKKVFMRLFTQVALFKNIPYLIKNAVAMLGRKKIYADKLLWRVMSDSGMKLNKSYERLDTQEKLKNLLSEKGYITEILRVNIPPDKRETWVEDKVRKGIDVLITNPSLVETGLDLNAFTTLVYYNIGYNLFTFRQSSRRSWRINQTAPRIEVYMLYYKGVMQERALKLMASKLAVATIIEGNLSDEGLAAMSECRDMTTLLAKELTLGIKSEVDDLSEAFKKMAIIHDRTEETQITEADENNVEEVKTDNQEKLKLYIPPVRVHTEVEISVSAAFSSKKRHSKAEYDDPDQISLFDLLAS